MCLANDHISGMEGIIALMIALPSSIQRLWVVIAAAPTASDTSARIAAPMNFRLNFSGMSMGFNGRDAF
jgi:hypothetical protein